jgi:hypothetical protein
VGPLVNERAHSSTSGGGKRGWVGLPRWAESAWEFSFFDLSFLFLFFVFFLISVLKFYSVHIELCIELLIKVQIQNTKSSMYTVVGVSRRGVPKPTSEYRHVPQPRWVDARPSAKGEVRWPETGVREVEIPRPSCSSRAQVGCACSRGYKRPRGRGSERLQASACLVLVPARPTPSKRALVLPFIGVRRGSRCTMGGIAECYVSSGGELAP